MYIPTIIEMMAAVIIASVAEVPYLCELKVLTTRHESDGTVLHVDTTSIIP